jgi:hypothetical protein
MRKKLKIKDHFALLSVLAFLAAGCSGSNSEEVSESVNYTFCGEHAVWWACSNSEEVSESVNFGTPTAPIDGTGPLEMGDWTDLTVNAVALCYPEYFVIEVSGVAAEKDSQSLDDYIEGLVGSKGVVLKPDRYYTDNPGAFCVGERPGGILDMDYGTPDVIRGVRQTTWVKFDGFEDDIGPGIDQIVLIMTDNGYSFGDRFYIKPSILNARVRE